MPFHTDRSERVLLAAIAALHLVAKAGQNAAEVHTTKVAGVHQPRNA